MLEAEHKISISVSSVTRILNEASKKSPRAKKGSKKHRSRERRASEGELVQLDASKHDWFGDGTYVHLHVAIDDATGTVYALHFDKEETFEGYATLMFKMNKLVGLPLQLYCDGRTVLLVVKKRR